MRRFRPLAATATAYLRRVGLALGGLAALVASANTNKMSGPWETGETAAKILDKPTWPQTFPLTKEHLSRIDESPDTQFYSQPRVNVQHIDEAAVATLGDFYKKAMPPESVILDLMSSWTSHLAKGAGQDKADGYYKRVSAVGMHDSELAANPALHDYLVHDLNAKPHLKMYGDNTFDVVFCSVSVDYLADPLPIFREVWRVLRPHGLAIFTWSNRMFPTKAIKAWREASEPGRLWICGAYFHYSVPNGWAGPHAHDLSPNPGRSDPVYAVSARKMDPNRLIDPDREL